MTREEQKYKVNNRHQLVDLNKDCTNFKLRFECYSDPKDKFQVCVTNQDELDTKDLSTLPFKDVIGGTISGNIVADTNTYQNYFIVLRADNECDVIVVVDLEPIEYVSPQKSIDNHEHEHVHNTNEKFSHVHANMTTGRDVSLWKRILFYIGIAILLTILAIYILKPNLGHDDINPSLIDDITNL